ncbi:hypothetical protein [Rufibacter quisquiliarum]|uniref:Uncharacterized protein n=1 Tax=Rufibacter quisquiliarum TaxID=1549639 RepID=A0A839GMD7_9BACT|nr:hypothetical protein [Rufibacter quisquiliarum]MBA9079890.1 hypothetical protein [Rufibacter quisquiliarum]
MASGFIKFRNGESWYARWSRYDWVLERIMLELCEDGKEGELKAWIESLLPDEDRGDIECGWSFIKATPESEMVTRILDTRLMKEEYQQIFWEGARRAMEKEPDKEDGIGFLINQLYKMYEESLNEEYVPPKPFNPEEDDIEDYQIGPGWK